MVAGIDEDRIAEIVEKHRHEPAALLAVLQEIQDELHWLPEDVLQQVGRMLDVPMTQVFRVATFYKALSLEPRGKHIIHVCMGTACHLKGAPGIVDAIQRRLGITPGETTRDMMFTVETAHCLGACAIAPVVTINGKYYGQMTPMRIDELIEQYREGEL